MTTTFSPEFFKHNRERLAAALPNSIVLLPAHNRLQYSADIAYPFRQDSTFWYFCVSDEPDVVVLLDTSNAATTIYRSQQSAYAKEWDGSLSESDLKAPGALDTVKDLESLLDDVKRFVAKKRKVALPFPSDVRIEPYGFMANPARRELFTKLLNCVSVEDLVDVRTYAARLRSIKQPEEIAAINEAIRITATALDEVRATTYTSEKQIENAITTIFLRENAEGHAYEPIVASGKNASVIHYVNNRDTIAKNSFLLLDVGARFAGYCADISRTWFCGNEPSKKQQTLYDIVLDVQRYAFSRLKAGVILKEYQVEVEAYAQKVYKQAKLPQANEPYPHGFSHFLGIDVHDAGMYDEPLSEGVVLTVEPGFYSQKDGLGIRIEDDVLITASGVQNLSDMIPKELLYYK